MGQTEKILQEINGMLKEKRMSYKEIYETLIAKGIMPTSSEKDFKDYTCGLMIMTILTLKE